MSRPEPQTAGWAVLGLLAVINLFNYYDRLLIVVVSQPLRIEFELSDTDYGLLTGPAFVFVYALASLAFGVLADKHRRPAVIGWALGIWSAMTALTAFATSFALLALGRAGVGVGEGGTNPAGMSLISDRYPPERRAMALAVFQAGGMVGMFLSFVVGSWLAATYGWRSVFLIAGIPGILLAIVAARLLPEPPRGQFDTGAQTSLTYGQAMRGLMRNKAYVWLTVAAAIGTFSSLGMLIWLPQFFIRLHGLDIKQVGFLFGPAAALGLCTGMLIGGWLSGRLARISLARPVLLCILANALLVPLFLIVLWTSSLTLALSLTFLAMALAVLYTAAFQSTMQTVCAPSVRASAAAMQNVMVAIIGQGLEPLLVGMLSDALRPAYGADALRWALTGATGFSLIAGLMFIRAYAVTKRQLAAA